uniref:Uncharacterized protein n=1 Tax=Apteryx owenii TaxID=8824 RepID=A0A8B9P5P2_APTOW
MDVYLMIPYHKTTIFTDAKETTTVFEIVLLQSFHSLHQWYFRQARLCPTSKKHSKTTQSCP